MAPKKGVKNPNMARFKDENGRWKEGKSSDYRRRITNAKPGELVHHKDKNKSHNTKDNFTVLKPGKGISAIGKHNREHPEKGKK
jgi:hypothetical protein